MRRCRPKGWAESIGFRWPTLWPTPTSRLRASSPRHEQGGRVETLMRRSYFEASCREDFQPQSGFDGRCLASTKRLANPTTPASAGRDPRLSSGRLPVPSARHPAVASADAASSHFRQVGTTRHCAKRVWSAYAADPGRSEFPLGPPSLAPHTEEAATRRYFVENDSSVVLRPKPPLPALWRARRGS
jgi:hypothetical protein